MIGNNDKITRGIPALCNLLGKYASAALLFWAVFCIFKFFFVQFGIVIGAAGLLCAILTVSLIIILPFLAKR